MVKKIGNTLLIKPYWVFNTYSVFKIKPWIDRSINSIKIDLSNTQIIDTDAIKFMYDLSKGGFEVYIKNPPDLMNKVLNVLDIKDHFYNQVKLED